MQYDIVYDRHISHSYNVYVVVIAVAGHGVTVCDWQ